MEYGPDHLGRQLFSLIGHGQSKVVVTAAHADNLRTIKGSNRETVDISSTIIYSYHKICDLYVKE